MIKLLLTPGVKKAAFLIDLPKLETNNDTADTFTQFYHDLVYFCRKMTLQRDVINRLSTFDFSKTKNLAFVHSM